MTKVAWLDKIGFVLSIAGFHQISNTVDYINEFPEVFESNLGSYKGPPVFFGFEARKVPFA